MINILKLVRYRNLLIIIATQYLMKYFILIPFLHIIKVQPQFSHFDFALLVLATTCLAAAGYAINDYFDRKVDLINHPDTVIVGTKVPRRMAMSINNLLNTIAIIAGFYISYRIGIMSLGFLFVVISGVLWFYSSTYKKWFLVGNFIVALFAALVPFLVLVYEIPLLNKIKSITDYDAYFISQAFIYITAYSIFAFLTTFVREIIKDIEDIQGDKLYGRRTLPIVGGVVYAKISVITLLAIILAIIVYITFFLDFFSVLYIYIFLVMPLVFITYYFAKANEKKHYRFSGNFLKLIMLLGLLYALIIPFIL